MTARTKPRDALYAAAPAALLLLFTLRAGTFDGAAIGSWAAVGHVALIGFASLGAYSWRDPLFLGRLGGPLIAGLIVVTVASNAQSPVPRAGWAGLLVLPAFLLVPAAVAYCWSTTRQRTIGLVSLAVVLALISLWSLVAWASGTGTRPALPLGHHNLLAAFLVMLLPIVVPLIRARGSCGVLGMIAGGLGLVTVVATRSLTGAVAVVVIGWISLPRRRRWPFLVALLALAAVQAPRIASLVRGDDLSAHARLAYARAGWDGLMARPLLGWGPGSTAWTVAEHLPPRPGSLPAGQVIGHLHNLPLQLGYELGWLGLGWIIVIVVLFGWRQRSAGTGLGDADGHRAACCGLLATALVSLGGLPLTVTVLPLTVAIVAGLALATTRPTAGPPPPQHRFAAAPAWVLLSLSVLGLARLDAGHLAYDRAVGGTTVDDQRAALDAALRFDPHHPLYRARRAWLDADAADAHRAARGAHGVAALWLAAGSLGLDAGDSRATAALERACRLDPLGPMAPFLLGLDFPEDSAATARLARALAAEPRLLMARALKDHPLRELASKLVVETEGLDRAWRDNFEQASREVDSVATSHQTSLALSLDGTAATALSLFTFRRRPWPTDLVSIALSGGEGAGAEMDAAEIGAAEIGAAEIGAATGRNDTDPSVFEGRGCTLVGPGR